MASFPSRSPWGCVLAIVHEQQSTHGQLAITDPPPAPLDAPTMPNGYALLFAHAFDRGGTSELLRVTGYHYRPVTYPPRPVWVRLDALLIRDPEMPRHTNGAGILMRGEVAGTLTQWIPTGSGVSPTPWNTSMAGRRCGCAISWCPLTHCARALTATDPPTPGEDVMCLQSDSLLRARFGHQSPWLR